MKVTLKDEHVIYDCPGCGRTHVIPTDRSSYGEKGWRFNRDVDKPTLTPSVKALPSDGMPLCHHWITNGFIDFAGDSDHKLAFHKVEMAER